MHSLRFLALLLAAQIASVQAQTPAADRAAVVATVGAFHDALARGDAAAAMRLLAPDAMIMEAGARESREEYHSHHLPADIEFAKAVPTRRSAVQVTVSGDVAWASSTSETHGTFRERVINSVGAELMVLSRTKTGWVIRAIHWSSRTVK